MDTKASQTTMTSNLLEGHFNYNPTKYEEKLHIDNSVANLFLRSFNRIPFFKDLYNKEEYELFKYLECIKISPLRHFKDTIVLILSFKEENPAEIKFLALYAEIDYSKTCFCCNIKKVIFANHYLCILLFLLFELL